MNKKLTARNSAVLKAIKKQWNEKIYKEAFNLANLAGNERAAIDVIMNYIRPERREEVRKHYDALIAR